MSDPPTSYTALVEENGHELINISRPSSPSEDSIHSDNPVPGIQQHQNHHQQSAIDLDASATASAEDMNEKKIKSKRQQTSVEFLCDWWPELLWTIGIFLALLATVLTLSLHQNKPLPQWPMSVSINALLSVYTVILKSAVLLVVTSGERQL